MSTTEKSGAMRFYEALCKSKNWKDASAEAQAFAAEIRLYRISEYLGMAGFRDGSTVSWFPTNGQMEEYRGPKEDTK